MRTHAIELHEAMGIELEAAVLVALGWGKRDWVEHDLDYDSLRDDPGSNGSSPA